MPGTDNLVFKSVLPGAGYTPSEEDNYVLLDSVGEALAAGIAANPGAAVVSRFNRYTTVNGGGGVISATPAAAGTTYVVGDLVYVTQSGAVAGTFRVSSIGAAGAVTGLTRVYRGTGYSTATGLATTTNSAAGSGLTVDLVAGPDSVSLPHAVQGMSVIVRNDSPATTVIKAVPTSGNAGTGYKVGDVITIVQSANVTATFVVAAITGGGATGPVGSLSPVTSGTGYTSGTGLTTTGGSGTGLQADITAGANALMVYPATGETIKVGATQGAANAGYSLANAKEVLFRSFVTGAWQGALSN